MESNRRFGQIETLLADLLRRMDRQAGQVDRQSDQIDDIIGILKTSDTCPAQTEERQDAVLAGIKQQGSQTEQQGTRGAAGQPYRGAQRAAR